MWSTAVQGSGAQAPSSALDWLLLQLRDGILDDVPAGSDPIVDVVESLRQQRMMMVQGEQQFDFLYDTVKELWIERWKTMHPEQKTLSAGDDGLATANPVAAL